MPQPYLCPMCKTNRARFAVIYKMSLEVKKEAQTGAVLWQADELELADRGGRADIDVKCLECGYVGFEGVFIRAAGRQDDAPNIPDSSSKGGRSSRRTPFGVGS